MAKAEWGIKRTCGDCSTKFYDFKKNPIICPKCETKYNPNTILKSKRVRASAVTEDIKAKSAVADQPILDDVAIADDNAVDFEELNDDFEDAPAIIPRDDSDQD